MILGHHSRFGALTEPAAQPRPAVVSGRRSFSPNVQPSDLTFRCTGRLRRLQRLPRASRGASRGACRGVRPFLGMTLNLQLSTFNRVSFVFPSSPHLCVLCGENSSSFRSSLIPRHSPLTSPAQAPELRLNSHLLADLSSYFPHQASRSR